MTSTATGTASRWPSGSTDPETTRLAAGILALVPAVALLLVTIVDSGPVGTRFPSGIHEPIALLAILGPASAALVLGLNTADVSVRVAMLFVGVFGLLSAVSETAMAPAAIALAGATVLLAATAVKTADSPGQVVVTVAFTVGVLASMAGAFGFEPAFTRSLGSVAVAGAIVGLPAFVGWSRRSVFVGLLAGAVVAGVGIAVPALVAAVGLLGMGIVGLPLAVLVVGAVGGGTAVTRAVETGRLPMALAGLLVLVAGVPATIPRALALIVGVALLLEGSR
ncbi:hypothetical protein RH831_04485 [Halodesulfurarchaeum sp. HSR-GB]|uniref:hypothetical protein n=1 Tax=Halodesulfurarchaeum sp. HSR-GB TaxID=3074077 RepID=UPI0028637B47|nr:hypothetical protein [Halodesulfurarchaeum sp. HSR-GB]MDR5656437.1 hypothetical protein [Halodesulfurarchaeum sp. HSR-GB]